MSARTVLVGLAGATQTTIGERLPRTAGVLAMGVRGALRPEPGSSTAAWISLFTGRAAAAHGVFDLYRKQTPLGHQLRALTARDLAMDAAWTHLDRAGQASVLLDLPLTTPAPRIEGSVVPASWVLTRQLKFGCQPSDLYRRLTDAGVAMETLAMQWPDRDAGAWVAAQQARLTNLFRAFDHLRGAETLAALLVRGAGLAERLDATEWFAALDPLLAKLASGEGNLVVVSEPAAAAVDPLAINRWLAARGDLTWSESEPESVETRLLDTDLLNKQSRLIDWTRTRAWAPLAGSGQVNIVRQDAEHPAGVPEPDYTAFRKQLSRELAAVPGVKTVRSGHELFLGPHADLAPDLVVTGEEQAGVFGAAGPAFRTGAAAAIPLLDVAPLLLHLAGLAIPADLEGEVPVGLLRSDWLEAHPVTRAQAPAEAEGRVLAAEAEEEVMNRLRDLGYIE